MIFDYNRIITSIIVIAEVMLKLRWPFNLGGIQTQEVDFTALEDFCSFIFCQVVCEEFQGFQRCDRILNIFYFYLWRRLIGVREHVMLFSNLWLKLFFKCLKCGVALNFFNSWLRGCCFFGLIYLSYHSTVPNFSNLSLVISSLNALLLLNVDCHQTLAFLR